MYQSAQRSRSTSVVRRGDLSVLAVGRQVRFNRTVRVGSTIVPAGARGRVTNLLGHLVIQLDALASTVYMRNDPALLASLEPVESEATPPRTYNIDFLVSVVRSDTSTLPPAEEGELIPESSCSL